MWFWPVLVLVLVILFVWWALTRQIETTETTVHHEPHANEEHSAHIHPAVEAPTEAAEKMKPVNLSGPEVEDDLTIIEGIGPKISSVLKAAGIKTFAQLAGMDAGSIREILMNNDPRIGRIADPTSWGEQSQMAAEGKMDALKVFQDNLKGGRAT